MASRARTVNPCDGRHGAPLPSSFFMAESSGSSSTPFSLRTFAPRPAASRTIPSRRCSVPTKLCPSSPAAFPAHSMASSALCVNFSLLFILHTSLSTAAQMRRFLFRIYYPLPVTPKNAKQRCRFNYRLLILKSNRAALFYTPKRIEYRLLKIH